MRADLTANDILLTQMEENEFKAETVGQFLASLTASIFSREGFYPNTTPHAQNVWEGAIAYALVLHGHIEGDIKEPDPDAPPFDPMLEYDATLDYNVGEFSTALNMALDHLHKADYSTLQLPPPPKEYYLIEFDTDAGHIVDTEGVPRTLEDSESCLKANYSSRWDTGWKIVHIPKVPTA